MTKPHRTTSHTISLRSRQSVGWLSALGFVSYAAALLAIHPQGFSPAGPLIGGVVAITAILAALSSTILKPASHKQLATFALLAAIITALGIFVAAVPAGTSTCAGPSDCDTSFGLGLPFIIAPLFIFYITLLYLGRSRLFALLLLLP